MVLAIPALLIVAAIEMTLRKKSLVWGTYGAGIGALAGLVALLAAWLVTGGWTEMVAPVLVALVFVGCMAFAAEIVLRGWFVQRALDVGAPAWLAIGVGAAAEAIVMPGGIGAGIFGIGLGVMYLRGGLRTSLCARLAFACGAVVLQLV